MPRGGSAISFSSSSIGEKGPALWDLLLLPCTRELCSGDAKAPAGTGSRKRERHLPLRERLSLHRFDGASLGLSRRIRSEELVDLRDLGELPCGVFHFGLTERDPAALDVDGNRHRLSVVAPDHTFAVGGLVDRRPALEVVCELTLRLAGRRCRGRREREHSENQNCRKSRVGRMAHVHSSEGGSNLQLRILAARRGIRQKVE